MFIEPMRNIQIILRKLLRMLDIILIESAQKVLCLFLLLLCYRVIVYVLEHELMQGVLRFFNIFIHADAFCAIFNNRSHQCCDSLGFGHTQNVRGFLRQILLSENIGTDGIFNVMVDVSDPVSKTHYISLTGCSGPVGMAKNAVADRLGEIQSLAVLFDVVGYTDALLIMTVSVGANLIQDTFTAVSEGRMSQVMSQCNGFCQIFIQMQRTGNGTGNLGYL